MGQVKLHMMYIFAFAQKMFIIVKFETDVFLPLKIIQQYISKVNIL